MNLFGSKGKFWIQKLFWPIIRSQVVTCQIFFMILILIQDNEKGCLENEQIWHYLKEIDEHMDYVLRQFGS